VSAPRKFDSETRQRAVRMYADRVRDGESKLGARRKVGKLLGVNPATLRNWIESAEKADRPVEPSGLSLADENARLKKENAELRRANEILKTASAFFAQAELDRRLR
jgi:transposase